MAADLEVDDESAGLLDLASDILTSRYALSPGLWSRAAALLVRQSLEETLQGYWIIRHIAVDRCSTRAQLICLRDYLREGDLAARVGHAWSALSRACHHHPYELPPTIEELRAWMEPVAELRDLVIQG